MSALRAYQLAYRLLAELFANGVTAQNALLLRQVPELSQAFPSDGDADTFAAAHYDALGLGVPPHESVFLDPVGVVGGVASRAVVDTYAQIGFGYDLTDVAPDHVAVQLEALVFSCEFSTDAQRAMLDEHLLRWIPSFARALRPYPLYAEAAELLLNVLLDHRASIGGPIVASKRGEDGASVSSLALDEPRTSIKDIAEFLCLPSASGLWLSRKDLADLGRGSGVPRGFGSRALMLGNMLGSAGDRGVLPDVIKALLAKVDEWRAMFLSLPDGLGDEGLGRLARTTLMLTQIGQAAREVA